MVDRAKKFISNILVLIAIVNMSCLSAYSAFNSEPKEDGYYYMTSENYEGWNYEIWVAPSVRIEAEITPENSYIVLTSYDSEIKIIDELESVVAPSEILGIPVKCIEDRANGNSNEHGSYWAQWDFKEISIPDGIEIIGENAFKNASNLTKVTISGTVKNIGSGAFYDCYDLTEVVLNEGTENIGGGAFSGTKLKKIKLPKSIKSIGDSAFSGTDLNCVEILGENIAFGYRVFENCKNLTTVKSESFSGMIETSIFDETPFKDNATCFLRVGNTLFDYIYTGETEITIPEGIKTINEDVFLNCEQVNTINLPESLEKIGEGAFRGCQNLSTITLPEKLTYIGEQAFYECAALKKIVLNEGIEEISKGTFENCISLEEIKIPNTVKSIKEYAFKYCKNLRKVTLGNNVEVIEGEAFMDCFSLSSIKFSDTLKQIKEKAFYGCPLEDVTILCDDIEIGNMAIGYTYDSEIGDYYIYDKCVITANGDSSASWYAYNHGISLNEIDSETIVDEDNLINDEEFAVGNQDADEQGDFGATIVVLVIVGTFIIAVLVYKKKVIDKKTTENK